ncbi:tryptophan--tRNA ligase, mitochondrial [Lethenteron reissneri]|uniref:tryptophan--tRNA ligase, mitochondrial n=1 Tax=Lethenteron reissneri TaxID=7753 RepID=UPI002AB77D91|nr:tryptophan--tRNA ligase, mitochondrial [Lethenteron reissneri]
MSTRLVGRGFFRFSWRRRGAEGTRRGQATTGSAGERRVILSGVQPSGVPHLGNVFGAMGTWRQLMRHGDTRDSLSMFCVADLHALTVTPDPRLLWRRCRITAAALVACGVDPAQSALFLQSQIPEHTELSWILGCLTTTARLSHLHQWKEKSRGRAELGSLGLLTYPVLQAADILLYRATHVPVGEDQAQHLELTLDLARAFNHRYGNYFPLPQAVLSDFPRIRSLQDPSSKMSKSQLPTSSTTSTTSTTSSSSPSPVGRPGRRVSLGSVLLSDSDAAVRLKLRRAVTDSLPGVSYEPATRPGVSNLLALHAAALGLRHPELVPGGGAAATPRGYKEELAEDLLRLVVRPLRSRFLRLMAGESVPPLDGGGGSGGGGLTWMGSDGASDGGKEFGSCEEGGEEEEEGEMGEEEERGDVGGDLSQWGFLGRVLEEGRERASRVAVHNLREVKRLVGLPP